MIFAPSSDFNQENFSHRPFCWHDKGYNNMNTRERSGWEHGNENQTALLLTERRHVGTSLDNTRINSAEIANGFIEQVQKARYLIQIQLWGLEFWGQKNNKKHR